MIYTSNGQLIVCSFTNEMGGRYGVFMFHNPVLIVDIDYGWFLVTGSGG